MREQPTTGGATMTREQLIDALNEEAAAGRLLVFLSKTATVVNAVEVCESGLAIQVTVDESPGSILGKQAAGKPKSFTKAERKRRKDRLADARGKRWES
jgi:hypothetical protein